MTRGILIMQLDGYVYETVEFNGDMYITSGRFEGYGKEIVEAFENMKDWWDFYSLVEKLNEYFQYPEKLICRLDPSEIEAELNFSDENSYKGDYAYIINLDKNAPLYFIDANEWKIKLNHGGFAALRFGKLIRFNDEEVRL